MKEKIKVGADVSYKRDFLRIEELGGINEQFIVFNPDYSSGKPDYKIQLTEKVLAKAPTSDQLIPIYDLPEDFVIINSYGNKIGDSENLNPEFVEFIIDMVLDNKSWDGQEYSCNQGNNDLSKFIKKKRILAD